MAKLHRVHQSQHVKAMLREERRNNAGTPNQQGGVSHFIQYRGNAPTDEEVRSSVQWDSGVERNEGVTFRWGPDLESKLK